MNPSQISFGMFFPILGGLIALVVWFIRLEAKAGANQAAIGKIEKEIERLTLQIEEHKIDSRIHFDERIAGQVDLRYNEKFNRVEADIHEMKTMLKEIQDAINHPGQS